MTKRPEGKTACRPGLGRAPTVVVRGRVLQRLVRQGRQRTGWLAGLLLGSALCAAHCAPSQTGGSPVAVAPAPVAAADLLAALCDRKTFPALRGRDAADVQDGDPRCGEYLK